MENTCGTVFSRKRQFGADGSVEQGFWPRWVVIDRTGRVRIKTVHGNSFSGVLTEG